ncbi:hypothetical protein V1514DRAFT_327702 [Lipomyces japonicus]|uniref:uncharacterized protein n=1 Tax=Lipomyces japonicus TaxID=56871 RepID=UPI0034CF6FBA
MLPPPSLTIDSTLTTSITPPATAQPAPSIFALTGQVAVITGGAQGLGFAMAAALCAQDLAGLAILDLNPAIGQQAADALRKTYGTQTSFFKVDITDEAGMKAVFEQVAETFGGLDIVVSSAGIVDNYPAEQYPVAKFVRLLSINLTGSFITAQVAFPYLKARGGGSIVFVGSMSGHIVNTPQPQSAYNASKAGVIHLSKSLAVEWAPHGIRCNSISPGYMATPLVQHFDTQLVNRWIQATPLGRMGRPEELQGVVVWLASKASSFTTGADISVDGGYTAL